MKEEEMSNPPSLKLRRINIQCPIINVEGKEKDFRTIRRGKEPAGVHHKGPGDSQERAKRPMQ